MHKLIRFLVLGAISNAAFLLNEGIVAYIPCTTGMVCERLDYELKRYVSY